MAEPQEPRPDLGTEPELNLTREVEEPAAGSPSAPARPAAALPGFELQTLLGQYDPLQAELRLGPVPRPAEHPADALTARLRGALVEWETRHQTDLKGAEDRLEQEKARAAAERAELHNQIQDAWKRFGHERSGLQATVQELLEQVKALEEERGRLQSERDQLVAGHQEQKDRFEREVAERGQQAETLTRQLQAAQAEGEERRRETQELRRQLETTLAALNEQTEREKALLQQLEQARGQGEQHGRQSEDLRRQLESALAQGDELRGRQNQLLQQLEHAQGAHAQKDEQAAGLRKELQATLAEAGELRDRERRILQQLEQAQQALDQQRAQEAALRQQVETALAQAGERGQREQALLQQLEEARREGRQQGRRGEELTGQVVRLQSELEQARSRAEGQAGELEATRAQLAEQTRRQSELEQRLVALQETLAAVRSDGTAKESELAAILARDQARTAAVIEEGQTQLAAARGQIEALARQRDELVRQRDELAAEKEQARLSHQQARQEIGAAAARWQALYQQSEQQAAELRAAQAEIDSVPALRQQVATLQTDLETGVRTAREELKDEVDRLTRALREARQLADATLRKNCALEEHLQAARESEAETHDSLAALQRELETTRAELVAQRRQQVNNLAGEQALLSVEQQKWRQQLEVMQAQFDQDRHSLEDEVERMRQQALTLRQALQGMGVHL